MCSQLMIYVGICTAIDFSVQFSLLCQLRFLNILQKQPFRFNLFKLILFKAHIFDQIIPSSIVSVTKGIMHLLPQLLIFSQSTVAYSTSLFYRVESLFLPANRLIIQLFVGILVVQSFLIFASFLRIWQIELICLVFGPQSGIYLAFQLILAAFLLFFSQRNGSLTTSRAWILLYCLIRIDCYLQNWLISQLKYSLLFSRLFFKHTIIKSANIIQSYFLLIIFIIYRNIQKKSFTVYKIPQKQFPCFASNILEMRFGSPIKICQHWVSYYFLPLIAIENLLIIFFYTYNMKRVILLLIIQIFFLLVQSQILAIDYGTQFIKAALVNAGAGKAFSIVENPKSQRKFINSMGIYNQERFYQADTLSKRSRGPDNCFIYSRLLVDLHNNPSQLERVKKDLVLQYLNNPQSDQLLAQFVLSGMGEAADSISLLETVAMMIKYVKRQAQKAAKATLKDVVLIVPSFWSLQQRKFLSEAASLADLYVVNLINENTAAALNYALSQRATNDTETILFYNLGANSLQMSLAQFKQVKSNKTKPVESVFILNDYGRPYIGGLTFDSLIANYFAQKFQDKHKKTLNQRALIRLHAESQKMKKILSSNKEATVFVQGIMDGIDFSAVITRKQFEDLAQETFKQLVANVRRFIFDADLKPQELTGVQVIGGGARVPRLQTLLGQTVGNLSIVGSHINGDEAMVFGAAFYGANSSTKFKVKGINLYDGFNFDMRIVLRNAEEGIEEGDSSYYFKNATLFKKKNRFGLTKEVSFKCKQNLIVQIYKEDENGDQLISSSRIDKIKDINQSNFKISLTFEIHPIEVVRLQDVKYLYSKEVVQSYTEKIRKVIPINKTEEKEEPTEQKQSAQKDQQEQKQKTQSAEDEQTDAKQSNSNEEEDSNDKKKESAKNKTEKKKKEKKQKITYETVEKFRNVTKNLQEELQFKQTYSISANTQSENLSKKAKKIFAVFEAKEQFKRKLAESKNKLQALIYEIRDRVEQEQFLQYSQPKQIELLQELVQQKSSWYEDTVSNQAEDYRNQFRQLNQPVQKIKRRMLEHRQREEVLKRAIGIVQDYLNQTKKIRKGKSWIPEQEVSQLVENITKVRQSIQKIYAKIIQTPINRDSAYRNKDLIRETEQIKDQFFALKGKPKPKGYKEEKEEEKAEKRQQKKEQEVKQDEL